MNLPKLTLSLILAVAPVLAASCDDLAKAKLPNTTITAATVVARGAFVQPGPANGKGKGPNPYANTPEFCRVELTIAPTSDSDIKAEVWLPTSGWNGKFQAVGNGGWAGVITYNAMAQAVERGYASASTDTGHVGGRGIFAMGHPEKLIDYSYRSVHEMTVEAKSLVQQFYGSPARLSYWVGCSTGGRQGLTEAQRYPNDFDGIVAGAPANYFTHLHAWSLWTYQAVHKTPESMMGRPQFQILKNAAIAACDALDGVKDGLIGDPTKCKFDPATVECKGGATADCLTAAQVAAAKQLYSPATNPRTKAEVFPPFEPGGEMGWGILAGQNPADVAADTFRYVVFNDPDWDAMTLNFDSDMKKADDIAQGYGLNSTDPDLGKYFGHNGKILMYHGWTDQLIAPVNSVNYYNSVAKKMGGVSKIDQSLRLFMVPGMNHCNGGDGPSSFDAVTLLEQWVEKGQAPAKMIASHATRGEVDRTRPLCPYPQVAKYDGSGSTDEASNFACVTP